MNSSHLAGGPLGVARVDRPRRPPSRKASRGVKAILATLAGAVRVLAGAAIVEAVAASSFGFLAGTAIVLVSAAVVGIAYLALRQSPAGAARPDRDTVRGAAKRPQRSSDART